LMAALEFLLGLFIGGMVVAFVKDEIEDRRERRLSEEREI